MIRLLLYVTFCNLKVKQGFVSPGQESVVQKGRGSPSDRCCEACIYWNHDDAGFARECRRFPPQYAEFQENRKLHLKRLWPLTPPTDWCGEFCSFKHARIEAPHHREPNEINPSTLAQLMVRRSITRIADKEDDA